MLAVAAEQVESVQQVRLGKKSYSVKYSSRFTTARTLIIAITLAMLRVSSRCSPGLTPAAGQLRLALQLFQLQIRAQIGAARSSSLLIAFRSVHRRSSCQVDYSLLFALVIAFRSIHRGAGHLTYFECWAPARWMDSSSTLFVSPDCQSAIAYCYSPPARRHVSYFGRLK